MSEPIDMSDEFEKMVSEMEVNTWPVRMKSITTNGRPDLASLDCTVVHTHEIVTYSVKTATRTVLQTSDYAEAKASYDNLK